MTKQNKQDFFLPPALNIRAMTRTPLNFLFCEYRKQTLVRICVIDAGYEYPVLASLACRTSRTKPQNENKKELVLSYFDRLRV